jgi:hypothetical protein
MRDDVDRGCAALNVSCPSGLVCLCKPCTRDLETQISPWRSAPCGSRRVHHIRGLMEAQEPRFEFFSELMRWAMRVTLHRGAPCHTFSCLLKPRVTSQGQGIQHISGVQEDGAGDCCTSRCVCYLSPKLHLMRYCFSMKPFWKSSDRRTRMDAQELALLS